MVKPGYRCLFYGPPGTGQTLTAALIGAAAGGDVYRLDLSMVVSKVIGETERNLATVFDEARDNNAILFFDDADALFGKRTEGSLSNGREMNQAISYLLQRLDDFPGLAIVADADELAGGAIANVVRHAAICASGRGVHAVSQADLLQGIRKEISKHCVPAHGAAAPAH